MGIPDSQSPSAHKERQHSMFTDDHAFVTFPVMVPGNVSNASCVILLPRWLYQVILCHKNRLLPLRDQLQLDSWTVSGNSSTVKTLSAYPGLQAQGNRYNPARLDRQIFSKPLWRITCIFPTGYTLTAKPAVHLTLPGQHCLPLLN